MRKQLFASQLHRTGNSISLDGSFCFCMRPKYSARASLCCHAEQSKDRYSQLRFNQTNTYGIYISVRRILSCFRRVLSEADCPPCEGAELRDPLTHSTLSATALMLEAPAVLLMVALIPAVQVPTQQKGQCCLSSSMKTQPLQKSLGALGATE